MVSGAAGFSGAQDEALRRLVDEGALTREQGEAVRQALAAAEPARRGGAGWLVEIAGYAGGGLMIGGVALFVAASWETLSRVERSGLLAGFALAFVVAGLVVAGGPRAVPGLSAAGGSGVRRRIVGVLFALAAVPAAVSVGVATDRYSGLAGAAVGLVVAVAGWAVVATVPGALMAAAMSFVVTTEGLDEVLTFTPLRAAGMFLAVGTVWMVATVVGPVRPRWLGFATGAGFALFGAQQPLADDATAVWAYGLTLGVALASFLLYRWQRQLVLLVAGIVGVTLAVPEAVADVTNGALGGSVILLVAGAVLVGASAVGLRLRRAAPPAPDHRPVPEVP